MARNPPFIKLECPAEVVPRLGKQSDRSIARERGCHPETVQVWRREYGIAPWRQPKNEHLLICASCQRSFTLIGSSARTTCPPPRNCQYKLGHKTRKRRKSKTNMRQLRGLMERHILRDRD